MNLAAGQVEPAPPLDPSVPPPHRPDVPCETQEPPNLDAPSGPAADPAYTAITGGGTSSTGTPLSGAAAARSARRTLNAFLSSGRFDRAVERLRREEAKR
jgi:hypothetical protein